MYFWELFLNYVYVQLFVSFFQGYQLCMLNFNLCLPTYHLLLINFILSILSSLILVVVTFLLYSNVTLPPNNIILLSFPQLSFFFLSSQHLFPQILVDLLLSSHFK